MTPHWVTPHWVTRYQRENQDWFIEGMEICVTKPVDSDGICEITQNKDENSAFSKQQAETLKEYYQKLCWR